MKKRTKMVFVVLCAMTILFMALTAVFARQAGIAFSAPSAAFSIPGVSRLEIAEPGEYYIYYCYDQDYQLFQDVQYHFTHSDGDTASSIRPDYFSEYAEDGRILRRVSEITLEKPGVYSVDSTYILDYPLDFVVRLSRFERAFTYSALRIVFAAGSLLFAVLAVAVFLRRNKPKVPAKADASSRSEADMI